ncbi:MULTISPECIES: SUKH-4 family immunity protein [Shewanella]|nr:MULTISPECIES: SUKH-4 family immunity protein [Shewanella]NRB25800.1 SUKH-4 family immunity protein [Shewanella sp.]
MENESFWEDIKLIKTDQSLLRTLGFSSQDISVLSGKGLPEWAAPNMNFDIFEPSVGRLKLGEDRDDQDIFISLNTFKVLFSDRELLVNSSVQQFRGTLKVYAQMIDNAIEVDEESVISNTIPRQLINSFATELAQLDPLAALPGTFWMNEVQRLLTSK